MQYCFNYIIETLSTASPSQTPQIRSFWEYIDSAHKRSPVFLNPLYCSSHFTSQVFCCWLCLF